MKLSKNKSVQLALGGVTVVGALALGFFAFEAYSQKTESADDLESARGRVEGILRAEISPKQASVTDLKKNSDGLAGWSEAALSTASVGDRAIAADVNAAAFKQKMNDEAHALAALPGGAEGGKLVKADFDFGFKGIIGGGELPAQERLAQLQRQWGDVRFIVGRLADSEVAEVTRIEPTAATAAAAAADEEQPKAKQRGRRRDKAAEAEKPAYTCEKYAVEFRANSAALVKAVNALAVSQRFCVVETFDFVREGDMIAEALGAGEKSAAAAQQQSTGRRRRRAAADEEKKDDEKKDDGRKGVVCNPASEHPFLVKLSVATYDFGSAVAKAEEAPAAEAAAPAAEAAAPAAEEKADESAKEVAE